MAAEAYAAPIPPATAGNVRSWTLRRPATAPGPSLSIRAQAPPAMPYQVPPTAAEAAYQPTVMASGLMFKCANNAQGTWSFVAKLYVHHLEASLGNQAATQSYAAAPAAAAIGQVLGSSWRQSTAWFVRCGQPANGPTSQYLLTSADALMKTVPAHDGTYTRVGPPGATRRVYADMAVVEYYDTNGVHYAWVEGVSIMDNYATNAMTAPFSNGAALRLGAAGLAIGGFNDPPPELRLNSPLPAAVPLPIPAAVNIYRAPVAFAGWPNRMSDFIPTNGLHIARRPPAVPNSLLLTQYPDAVVQRNAPAGNPFPAMLQWSNNPNAGPGGNPPPGIQSTGLEGGVCVISAVAQNPAAPGPPVAQRLAIGVWIQDGGVIGIGAGFQTTVPAGGAVTGIDVKGLLQGVGIPAGNLTWTPATTAGIGVAGNNWNILS